MPSRESGPHTRRASLASCERKNKESLGLEKSQNVLRYHTRRASRASLVRRTSSAYVDGERFVEAPENPRTTSLSFREIQPQMPTSLPMETHNEVDGESFRKEEGRVEEERMSIRSIISTIRDLMPTRTRREAEQTEEETIFRTKDPLPQETTRLLLSLRAAIRSAGIMKPTDESASQLMLEQLMRVANWSEKAALRRVKELLGFRRKNRWPLWHIQLDAQISATRATRIHELLPGRDCHGRRMITFILKNYDPKVESPEIYHKMATLYLQEATHNDPETQKKGVVLLCDFRGASMRALRWFSTKDIVRGNKMWVSFPIKLKGAYLIRPNFAHRLAIRSVMSVVSEEMRNMVTFVGPSGRELLNEIPRGSELERACRELLE